MIILHKCEGKKRTKTRYFHSVTYTRWTPNVTRVRDPFQLGSAQRGQLVTAQGIPITKSRKEQERRWQRGEVTSVPRVRRSPSQRVWNLSPSWTNFPRLIKYGAFILATRRRQSKGEREGEADFHVYADMYFKTSISTAPRPREQCVWRYFRFTIVNSIPRRYCVRGSQWIIASNR